MAGEYFVCALEEKGAMWYKDEATGASVEERWSCWKFEGTAREHDIVWVKRNKIEAFFMFLILLFSLKIVLLLLVRPRPKKQVNKTKQLTGGLDRF